MRHAPYFLHRCGRPWCLRRRLRMSKIPECATHKKRSLPARRAAMARLVAQSKPVKVSRKDGLTK